MKLETFFFLYLLAQKKYQSIRKKFYFDINELRFLKMMGKVATVKKIDSIGKTVTVCEIKREQYSDVDSSSWLV